MEAHWSNAIEERHGEKLILSKAKSILVHRMGNKRISSDLEFENGLLISVNKDAQDGIFKRIKWAAEKSQYKDLKEDIALEPDFFGKEYYAELKAGVLESKLDLDEITTSKNTALLGELVAELVDNNPSIEAWDEEFIAKLLDDIELELAEETLARKHL